MNLIELQRALRQLRLSGMAMGLETRLLQAQTDKLAPIDFLSTLLSDELLRRQDGRLFGLDPATGTKIWETNALWTFPGRSFAARQSPSGLKTKSGW